METPRAPKNELFYTRDHEWINFRDSVAYTGVCAFKLTGIRQIRQIEFANCENFKKAGEILAVIFSGDYQIPVHMPVDGEVICYNEALLGGNQEILLEQPERDEMAG